METTTEITVGTIMKTIGITMTVKCTKPTSTYLRNLVENQQPRQPSIVSEFKRLNSPTSNGATDPTVMEMWVQEMEKAFELLGNNDGHKVTYDWWLMEQSKMEGNLEPITWERFKTTLTDKYFSRTVRVQKERYFIKLEQGERSVEEYEAECTKLGKYA